MNRFRQRMTALNYAIQTTPPPKKRMDRIELESLNLELLSALYQMPMPWTWPATGSKPRGHEPAGRFRPGGRGNGWNSSSPN